MSRNLQDLHSWVREKAEKLILLSWERYSLDILIYFTIRTFAEQDELYRQGRDRPGKIVTWAKGGESYHNYGLAFDFVPYKPGTKEEDWENGKVFQLVGELGEDLGLQWGGRWPGKKRDMPHLQYSFGLSIHDLQSIYAVGGLKKVWFRIDEVISKL